MSSRLATGGVGYAPDDYLVIAVIPLRTSPRRPAVTSPALSLPAWKGAVTIRSSAASFSVTLQIASLRAVRNLRVMQPWHAHQTFNTRRAATGFSRNPVRPWSRAGMSCLLCH
jgi:hypothetical protein